MILIDLFIAGVQTTAVTLDFLFLYMTVHQDIQSKLHGELDSVIGTKRLPQLNDRPMLEILLFDKTFFILILLLTIMNIEL